MPGECAPRTLPASSPSRRFLAAALAFLPMCDPPLHFFLFPVYFLCFVKRRRESRVEVLGQFGVQLLHNQMGEPMQKSAYPDACNDITVNLFGGPLQ